MTLKKLEVTGNCTGKHYVALFGELALEEAKDLSLDYGVNE
jgi:hypothetical protein